MLGAAFGVGFVLGPTIGGILGHRDPSHPRLRGHGDERGGADC